MDAVTVAVACDLPSRGVDADTGHVAGGVIPADVSATFGTLKTSLIVGAGAHATGRAEVVDLGLGPHLGEPDVTSLERVETHAVFDPPAWDDHKYRRGVLEVCARSELYPGGGRAGVFLGDRLRSGHGPVRRATAGC